MKFSEMISNQSTAGWRSRMYGKWTVRRPRPRPRLACPRRESAMFHLRREGTKTSANILLDAGRERRLRRFQNEGLNESPQRLAGAVQADLDPARGDSQLLR